jgi:NADPH-dependent ferric siderophore reductase
VSTRVRREPPRFRRVEVTHVGRRSPRLVAVTLAGPELDGFELDLPAASVRLLLPSDGADEVELPTWTGNEFLAADGTRAVIRTLTPLRVGASDHGPGPALDVEVVLHGDGPLSTWAAEVGPGAQAAVSGPGRGYAVDPDAPAFLLAGDESALPAIGQLLSHLPGTATVAVLVEVADPDARIDLPGHPRCEVRWLVAEPDGEPGGALVDAVAEAELDPDARVWAAGEAAAMHRIRRHLFDERGLPRSQATVRGYWKRGRGGDDTDD